MEAISVSPLYVPPSVDAYKDWSGHARPDYQLSERQKPVVDAVRAGLKSGLFYSDALLAFCKTVLGVTQEQAAVGAKRVEGGEVGMDCYYARNYIEAQLRHTQERQMWVKLAPRVGMKLGTLVFNDYKRNTNVEIVEILDGPQPQLKLALKRSAHVFSIVADAGAIARAIDRAHDRKLRAQGFEAFIGETSLC